jgi:hypothetical protein
MEVDNEVESLTLSGGVLRKMSLIEGRKARKRLENRSICSRERDLRTITVESAAEVVASTGEGM